MPTISAAVQDPADMEFLKKAISEFTPTDRQRFLEGLQTAERFIKLENEKLNIKTIIKNVALSGVNGIGLFVITLLLAPEFALRVGVGVGAATMAIFTAEDRNRKRDMIARITEMRNAVVSAEVAGRS